MMRALSISLVAVSQLAVALAVPVRAADLDGNDAKDAPLSATKALRFRRIFVPADRPEEWPTAGERYLPLETAEFTRFLELAEAAETAAPGALAASIERIRYEARLVDDNLLKGRATLDIKHNSATPALVPLDPWTPAVVSARWETTNEPAKFGNLPNGKFCVIADRSGKLIVEWMLRGARQGTDEIAFPLRLPHAVLSQLMLEVPVGRSPELEQAIVSQTSPIDQAFARWKIELGGRSGGTLRLAGSQNRDARRNFTLLRQANTYTFTPRGLDLAAELHLNVNGDSFKAVTLRLDSGLQLVAARCEGQDLTWSISAQENSDTVTAQLELAKPISGSNTIQLTAVATFGIGKLKRLPRIHAEGLVWQEESSQLVAQAPYVIERLVVLEGRQVSPTSNASKRASESLKVQSFSSDATIEVRVDHPADRVAVEHNTRVEFSSNELSANCVAEFKMRQGSRAEFVCDVSPLWQIDSVEAQEPFAVADWDVDGADPQRKLTARIVPAVAANQSVRLSVIGRRNLALREPMDVDNLRMLRFPAMTETRKFLVLKQPESLELQAAGLERITRVDPASFAANDPLRMTTSAKDIAFAIDAAATPLAVTLVPRKPKFDAKIRVDAQVAEKSVTEVCRLHCEPSGVAMERLLVHFSTVGRGPWQWSAGAAIGPLAVRRLSADEQLAAGAGAVGEVYELRWTNPQRASFELRGTRSVPFTIPFAVTLVELPDAAEQTGLITVRVADGSAVTINNHQLPELPAEIDAVDPPRSARGLFRYTPARDGLAAEPPLELIPAEFAQEESGAFAWTCELDTRLAESGVASHIAVFKLQTGGQSKVRMAWPVGATPRGVWVDTRRVRDASLQNREGFTVDLPQGKTFATITLDYVTGDTLPRFIGSYQPPFATATIPILGRRWRLWLPNNYNLPAVAPSAYRYCATESTWAQRLFGPLGRGVTSPSANPLNAAFWTWDGVTRSEQTAASRHAAAVSNLLNAAVAAKDQASTGLLSWGQLFAALNSAEDGVSVRIDSKALAELGITAATRVANIRELDANAPGHDLLRRSHLVLLVRSNHVLISTSVVASLNYRSVQPLQSSTAYYVLPGALAADILADADARQPLAFLTPSAWQTAAQLPAPNWTLPDNIREILADNGVRKAYQFDLSDKSPVTVTVQNQAALLGVTSGVMLLVMACGLSFGWAKQPVWPVLVAIAFAVAILAPMAWSPLGAAIFASGLATWLWALRRTAAANSPANGLNLRSTPKLRLATATAVIAGLIACHVRLTQAVEAFSKLDTSKLTKVLVPVDDEQRPSGGKVFVPDAFYRELCRQAELAREQPRNWIFTKARYRVALGREAPRGDATPEVRASLDLLVFDQKQTVKFALGGEHCKVQLDTAQLNGQPTAIESRGNGEWSASVDEAGSHRLEITLVPTLQRFGTTIGFDATVPPVASAEAEVIDTDATDLVKVPTAIGDLTADKIHNRMLAGLGATSRLAVRWPEGSTTDASPSFELDELLWAKVQPGSATIDARLNIRVIEGRLRRLKMLLDPRLQLLSSIGAGSQIAAVHSSPENPHSLEIELANPLIEQGVVDLKFSVIDASGIGTLQLPRCEVADVRAARRWLALWVDPALEFHEQVGDDLQAMAVPEFVATWGNPDVQPQTAFRIPRGEVAWAVSTRPRPPVVSVEQDTVCGIEPNNATIRWQSKVNVSLGELFQFSIETPAELIIDSITAREEDTAIPMHWARDQDGLITLMFGESVAGTRLVTLEGRLAHATGKLIVPSIQLEGAELIRSAVYVYRHPLVLANAVSEGARQPPTSATSQVLPPVGQSLVAAFTSQKELGKVSVDVKPNRPVTMATEVVTVDRDADGWFAELGLNLEVQEGIVDSLLFDIPPEWIDLVAVDQPGFPAASLSVVIAPGETARRLLFTPAEPIHDHWRLTVRGKISSTAGDRLRISDIDPKGLTKVDRFLLLPRQLELESVAWETSRLIEAELPADVQLTLAVPESHTTYRILEGRAHALLRTNEPGRDQAQVTLAVTHFAWQWDGRVRGTASFDLEPGSATDFVLTMPAGFSPIHLTVDNLPWRFTSIAPGRWQLELDSSGAPRHIELVFLGNVSESNFLWTQDHLEGPAFEQVPALRRIWSVTGPSQVRPKTAPDGSAVASPAQVAFEKMKSAATLGDVAFDLSASQPDGSAARWFRPWWDRFVGAKIEFEIIRLAGQDQDAAISTIATEVADLEKHHPHGEGRNIVSTESSEEPAAMALFGQETGIVRPEWHSAQHALSYDFPSLPANDFSTRVLVGLAIIFGGIVAAFRLHHQSQSLSTATLGLVTGAICWLMLQPAWIGVALILFSLLTKARSLSAIAKFSEYQSRQSNASNS